MPNSAPDAKPLVGRDYMCKSLIDLQSHPDFSHHALRVVAAISKMTTKELEQLTLPIVRRGN